MTVFITNLPCFIDDSGITRIFELFGNVASAEVFKCPVTTGSTGSAVLEMPDAEQASFASLVLNGMTIENKKLSVTTVNSVKRNPRVSQNIKMPASKKLFLVEN